MSTPLYGLPTLRIAVGPAVGATYREPTQPAASATKTSSAQVRDHADRERGWGIIAVQCWPSLSASWDAVKHPRYDRAPGAPGSEDGHGSSEGQGRGDHGRQQGHRPGDEPAVRRR